jgi:predicted nucleic acid-binding protein
MHAIDTTFLIQVELREAQDHLRARAWLNRTLESDGQLFALAPQVLTEFIHVVTDPRRFALPLSMEEATERAQLWCSAKEVRAIYPTAESTALTLQWLRSYRLGRKRLLDTQLAATYSTAGIHRLLTANADDFAVFEVFNFTAYAG